MCKNCRWFPCTKESCDLFSGGCECFITTVQDMINKIEKENLDNGDT